MRDALLQKKAAAEQWPTLYERMERSKAEFFQARQQREQMLQLKERAEAELERHKRGLALTHKRKALRAQAEIAYQQAQLQYQVATMRQTQLREALDAAVRREREGWRDAQDYQQYRTEVAARLAEEDAGVRQAWQNVRVLGRVAELLGSARRRLESARAATGGPEPDYRDFSEGARSTAGEWVAAGVATMAFGLLGMGVALGAIAIKHSFRSANTRSASMDDAIKSAQRIKEEVLAAGREVEEAARLYIDQSGQLLQVQQAVGQLAIMSFMRGPNSEAAGHRISELLTQIYELQMEIAGYLEQENAELEGLLLEKLEEQGL